MIIFELDSTLADTNNKPIPEVVDVFQRIDPWKTKVAIWTGRCESTRKKTKFWIINNLFMGNFIAYERIDLKMRPVGDDTPLHKLKEKWLQEDSPDQSVNHIAYVFDNDPQSIEMYHSHGIFTYDVNQEDEDN